jgi:hypothetical protein
VGAREEDGDEGCQRTSFDSSAIVKRYYREAGTVWVQAICEPRDHPPLYLSQLAHVEVIAALRRVGRTQGLHPAVVDTMVSRFERHIILSDSSRAAPLYRLEPAKDSTSNTPEWPRIGDEQSKSPPGAVSIAATGR